MSRRPIVDDGELQHGDGRDLGATEDEVIESLQEDVEDLAHELLAAQRSRDAAITERARMEVTLGRHVRWREAALEFFHQVMNDRATEFKWPKLVEFVEQSETHMVSASAPSTNAELQSPRSGEP
jgi:hypothetical protein